MSADPFTVTPGRVVDPQQLNLYAYVRNNPLKHIDSTGMLIDDAACKQDMKHCGNDWQKVQDVANQQDKNGNYGITYIQSCTMSSPLQNFSTTNTSWIGTMEIAALRAYQNAFAKCPISVVFATTHPQLLILQGGYVQVLDQGFAAYIVGSWPVPSSGLEFPGATGRLYYLSFMGDAQVALGHAEGQGPDCGQSWCDLLLAYPPTQQTTLAYAQLMTSIGTAMGNAATHETGHYLETVTPNGGSGFPYMDCGAGRNDGQPVVPCEGNNNFVYNFDSSEEFMGKFRLRQFAK